ncbi:L10-interacting MYB domain-containing protein-like [Ipomoea triloba]|uniref:L10-interacting MYB domain-containing protein-like n=1 Tax=Ipomoea triloba TaxID=35885 RepID=UPI00125DFFFB|nr:L10-interacting MYB domain-containing protein-like [Ipomoea triloba]XP_031109198.1 L10-interacting MYB domain-containing protein-like [Ipomoea triloba]XP_031109199.1 L10-interacting MYB domain-containing protein-like [Ipomoea triloba]
MATRPTRSRRQVAAQQPESQSRAKWNAYLTNILVELMAEQVRLGNKQNKSFNKEAWKCICEDFHKETGLPWDQEQLKSRYTALRKHYAIVKSILDQSDFKWDEPTGAIVATDEAWDAYIKEHPDAETLRSAGCSIYKQLHTIFAETGTKGKSNGSTMSKERPSGSQPSSVFEDKLSSSESEEEADMGVEEDKLQSTNPSANSSRKKGRKGVDDFIAKAILEMAAASRLRADAIKKLNERYTITDCIRALDELQGVNDQVYFAALDLFNNRSAREIFLSLQGEKRLTWLHCKVSRIQ